MAFWSWKTEIAFSCKMYSNNLFFFFKKIFLQCIMKVSGVQNNTKSYWLSFYGPKKSERAETFKINYRISFLDELCLEVSKYFLDPLYGLWIRWKYDVDQSILWEDLLKMYYPWLYWTNKHNTSHANSFWNWFIVLTSSVCMRNPLFCLWKLSHILPPSFFLHNW